MRSSLFSLIRNRGVANPGPSRRSAVDRAVAARLGYDRMVATAKITVNGTTHDVALQRERTLLHVLREELGLTGTKYACGEAECGACMVLLDGEPVPSCQTPVGQAAGRSVITIEGIARGGELHPVQQAFVALGALQCGFCTPGMIVRAVAFLAGHPDPTDADIRAALQRNVCRCGAHPRIVAAVRRAAELVRR